MKRLLLLDVGNTHTHVALATPAKLYRCADLRTRDWLPDGPGPKRASAAGARSQAGRELKRLVGSTSIDAAVLCSVVPAATPAIKQCIANVFGVGVTELTWRTIPGLGFDYPRPDTIGADRLANALAALHIYGAPVLVIGLGTAITFDVVDERGLFVGGAIAPGIAAGLGYLHEKTARLPLVTPARPRRAIGKSTKEAILAGTIIGWSGLVRELITRARAELGTDSLRVIATGGYAKLISELVPEISLVHPRLTLDGLRLFWCLRHQNQR